MAACAQEFPAALPAKPNATGTIAGRVFCGDTHGPARFAHVYFWPVPPLSTEDEEHVKAPEGSALLNASTGIDGNFQLGRVPPGKYYIDVSLNGYVPLVDMVAWKDLHVGSLEAQRKVRESLVMLDVSANQTARADVTVERGSAMGGIVRYQDGSPAVDANLAIGRAVENTTTGLSFTEGPLYQARTDDRGVFRFAGLPAGKYILAARLLIPDREALAPEMVGPSSSRTVEFFAPESFTLRDAKVYALRKGEELSGVEMTLLIDQFHSVGGRVNSEGKTGSSVVLWDPHPAGVIRGAKIRPNGSFLFENVPDGEYRIGMEDAKAAGMGGGVGVIVHGGDVTDVVLAQ